jgi:hypothetical protein
MDDCQRNVHRAGDEAFDRCDLHRIDRAQFAGQVVVDAPSDAGPGNREGTPAQCSLAPPRQQQGAGKDGARTNEQPFVDGLVEEYPSDPHGRQTLEIEEQRCRRSAGPRQPQHQQYRSKDSAHHRDQREPRQILSTQRSFAARAAKRDSRQLHKGNSDARTEVEQTGEQPGVHAAAEQQLGERR